ncbi:glycoside hydrolase [Trametopsis cervina]|nr:glycoside hydrolase [Trametopsis cervina]
MVELSEEVKREIGQHFVFGFHGHDVSEDIEILISKYYLGNVILMKRNVQDVKQIHGIVQKLQRIAKDAGHERPLMIGIDQENGLVSAFSTAECGTQFPGAMALATSGSVEIAEKVSHASASEMRLAGINWDYSPDADVNSDPRNPVIGVRSFGDRPNDVARYACAASKGLTDAKVAPSAKHFPGHGNTHVDSHLSLPRIMASKQDLNQIELVPFKALVESGIASIMTGHMALPVVTETEVPCSLSREITTDLLRVEMGYEGVIVTDCLEMEAVLETYGAEAGAVMALQAGADVVMICHTRSRQQGAIEKTYDAVANGALTLASLRESGKRVQALKSQFAGTWDEVLSTPFDADKWAALKEANASISRQAYISAMTLLRDPKKTLPLQSQASTPVLIFTPRVESINLAVDDADGVLRDGEGRLRNTAGPSYTAFAAAVARRVATQHVVYGSEEELPEAALVSASSVIFATRNGFEKGAWQVEYLRRLVQRLGDKPLVVVSTCAPYDVLGAKDIPGAVLATLEFTVPALETAAQVIFGEVEAKGVLPVDIST